MILEPYLVFPQPEQSEAEIITLLRDNEAWDAASKYLQRCLEHTIEELGKTENTRDKDEVLKGAKGTLEHIINLTTVAKRRLEQIFEEEEMPTLDERTPKKEEEANET